MADDSSLIPPVRTLAPSAPVAADAPPLPVWARTLDVVSTLLLALAPIVYIFGGFRERVFGVRLGFTEPERLLVWAAVALVLRHYFVPQRPLWTILLNRARAIVRAREWRTAALALVATRPAILLVGYLAVFLIGYPPKQPAWRISDNEFVNLQARWDAGWYYGIATDGYYFSPGRDERGEQQNIVFFPAYPLLMRIAGRLLGADSPATTFLGGTLVSWFAFTLALVYLYRFARDMLGDDDRAATAVWLVATYPFAVWFGATYTESLYLLGAIASMYHFERGQFGKAGIWGFLVGLTRPNGAFLSIPLALLALRPWLPVWSSGGRPFDGTVDVRRSAPPISAALRPLLAASLPGIAVLMYSAYIWQLTDNPLSWAEGHAAWGRSYQGLWVLVLERYQYLSESGVYAYTSQLPDDLMQVLGVLFVLIPVWPVARRLGLAYAVFILVNILPPLAAGGVLSAGRFSSVLFPAFVWAASTINASHRPAWLSAFMAVQALNAILFYTWREMF